jgi:hypothetical protein
MSASPPDTVEKLGARRALAGVVTAMSGGVIRCYATCNFLQVSMQNSAKVAAGMEIEGVLRNTPRARHLEVTRISRCPRPHAKSYTVHGVISLVDTYTARRSNLARKKIADEHRDTYGRFKSPFLLQIHRVVISLRFDGAWLTTDACQICPFFR